MKSVKAAEALVIVLLSGADDPKHRMLELRGWNRISD